MAKKIMEDILAQIESDIQMTIKRRAYAYSSEHAYYLDRDWESVETPSEFNASFSAQFANRNSFWF